MNLSTAMTAGKPLKVLVAEDNLINQRLVIAMLTELGHTGVVVGDGEKALKCLSKIKFDVVLMDVMMPLMDGIAALAAIRAQELAVGGHQVVVMATAHTEPGDAAKFKRAGADGYVAKPIAIELLQAEFDRLLGRR
jgi:CheY-like chemotaxis protein